jgi:hypothetical protein
MLSLLPVHLKPNEDELLSSWMVRLAIAHGVNPDTLYSSLVPSRHQFPNYVDEIDDNLIFFVLEKVTGVARDRIEATTLTPRRNNLTKYHSAGNRTPQAMPYQWIMPVSSRHLPYQVFGLQYCPICLSEDKAAYFRRMWRFAFVTLCIEHRVLLLDRCARCSLPIDYRRNATVARQKRRRSIFTMTNCYSCGYDIRGASPASVPRSTRSYDLKFQHFMVNTLSKDTIEYPAGNYLRVFSFFSNLYQLASLLAFGGFGKFIRTELCNRYGIRTFPVIEPEKYKFVENLNVSERYGLMRLVGLTIKEWPDEILHFNWQSLDPMFMPLFKS